MILISFIKRNILLYFRDRISVFFSLLSTLIVLTLMIAFLGQGNIDSTIQVLGTGLKYEAVHASSLIIIWTIAGILVVNAVSISMTLVGTICIFCCTRKTRILCCRLCHCCNYCLLYHVPAHIDNRSHLSWYC